MKNLIPVIAEKYVMLYTKLKLQNLRAGKVQNLLVHSTVLIAN